MGATVTGSLAIAGNTQIENAHLKIVDATPDIILSVPSGGLDSRIFNDGSGNFIIGHGTNSNTPTERMRIDTSGRLLVNTTSAGGGSYDRLSVANGIKITDDSNAKLEIGRYSSGAPNSYIKIGSNSNSLRITNASDNSDLFTFNNDGKLGIGTSSPSSLLELSGGGNTILTLNTGNNSGDNSQIAFGDSADADVGFINYDHGTNAMQFRVNGSERMRINTVGQLQIGDTTAADTSEMLKVDGAGASDHTGIGVKTSNNVHDGYIAFHDSDANFRGQVRYDHSVDAMFFNTAATERVRITSAGNVGINEDSPTQQLVIKATTDDNPGLALHRDSGGGDVASINWTSGSGTPQTNGRINYRGGGGGNDGMAFYVNSDMSSPAIWAALSKRIRLPGVPGVAGSNLTNVSIESDGNLCTTTSIRAAKKNIAAMTDTSWLFDLNPVTFNWRTKTQDEDGNIIWGEDTDGGTQYGLIAEEVKEVKDDFCYYDNDGNLTGVHYDRLVAPLLKAIQDLKAENTALTTRVAALEAA
jgi:hypothetical protein